MPDIPQIVKFIHKQDVHKTSTLINATGCESRLQEGKMPAQLG